VDRASHCIDGSSVLVAGGAGFVGSALVRRLLTRCRTVVCYDSFVAGTPENVAGLGERLTVVEGDVRDRDRLENTLRAAAIDYVVNCVGDPFVPDAYADPQRFFDINLTGCLQLLLAAQAAKVRRTLHVSTVEVYGEQGPGEASTESSPLVPRNTYAVSKLAGDRLCYTLYLEHRVPVLIARISNCYGARETHPYVVPELISQLWQGRSAKLGDLDAERDYTFVDDTAVGLERALCSGIPDGQVVNIGSGVSLSVRDLAQAVAQALGRSDFELLLDAGRVRRREIPRMCSDATLLRASTGWCPETPLTAGLERTITWYQEHGCRWAYQQRGAQ
jgi:nucleoside-diphosphate-sugar epimerase